MPRPWRAALDADLCTPSVPSRRAVALLAGCLAVCLLCTRAGMAAAPLQPADIRVDLPATLLLGALPINRGLTLSVELQPEMAGRGDQLVAIFTSPAFVQQISPLIPDPERPVLATAVALGPIEASMGNPPKAAPIDVTVARQIGLHFEELARRTIVVTVAAPGYADHGSRPSRANLAAMSFETVTETSDSDAGEHLADPLLEGEVEETDLLAGGDHHRMQGYWRMLNRLIYRHIASQPVPRLKAGRRAPVVGFRLYANGEVQFIEIERSSGDADVDRAAILAVVDAHPFPGVPAPSSDSPINVHVSLPLASR